MLEEAEAAIKTLEYLEEVLPLVEQVVAVVLKVLELRHKQELQTLVVVVGLLLTLEQMVVQEL
jgi:hypothetical protein